MLSWADHRFKPLARIMGIISTILYSLLAPWFLRYALLSWLVFDLPSMTFSYGVAFIICFYLFPVSIPVCMSLVWYHYGKGNYKKSCWFCIVPIGLLLISIIASIGLDFIYRRFPAMMHSHIPS